MSKWLAWTLVVAVAGSGALAGCHSAATPTAVEPTSTTAPPLAPPPVALATSWNDGVVGRLAPHLVVLGGNTAVDVSLSSDPPAAAPPPPTCDIDLALFRGKVIWITFYSADC